jgi:hypothetical protein
MVAGLSALLDGDCWTIDGHGPVQSKPTTRSYCARCCLVECAWGVYLLHRRVRRPAAASSSLPPRGWGYGAWPEGPRVAALAVDPPYDHNHKINHTFKQYIVC